MGNMVIDGVVQLYHGSKSGLKGSIAPISRDKCDFGRGFYMGSERSQPLTLVCNYPEAELYTLNIRLAGLKLLEIEPGLEWALFIAYNRGKLNHIKNTALYERFKSMAEGYDLIVGYIANDRMFVVLDRFFNGEITDAALVHCLSALRLGKQYVARTEKACSQIEIVQKESLSTTTRERLKKESEETRSKGIALAEAICRDYRREGRFFDEILEAGEQYGDVNA